MQLTIRVPDEQMRKIEEIADRMGLKKSDVARLAIRAFIAEHDDGGNDYPFGRARELLGVAESGVRDLGQEHRQYLRQKLKKGS